jgi:hypothetical protein
MIPTFPSPSLKFRTVAKVYTRQMMSRCGINVDILATSPGIRLGQRQPQTGSPETQCTCIAAAAPLAGHFGKSPDYLWPQPDCICYRYNPVQVSGTAASAAMKPRICLPPSLPSDLAGRPEPAQHWTLSGRIAIFGKEAPSPSRAC